MYWKLFATLTRYRPCNTKGSKKRSWRLQTRDPNSCFLFTLWENKVYLNSQFAVFFTFCNGLNLCFILEYIIGTERERNISSTHLATDLSNPTEKEVRFFSHTILFLKNAQLLLEKYNGRSKITLTEGLTQSFVLNYPQEEPPLSNNLMKTVS